MKRYIKVILTTFLALSILLGAFAGCSNEKNDKKAEAEAKKIAMKTDNFSVSLGMMKYFYQVAYTSFVGDAYYNFLKAQCSLNNSKYGNQDLPLNQQKIGQGSYDAFLVSDIENYKDKTWHDYFVDQATATVKETLIFCEMAKERNVSLTDDEKAEIQLEVKKLAESMKNTIDADGKMMYSGLTGLARNIGYFCAVVFSTARFSNKENVVCGMERKRRLRLVLTTASRRIFGCLKF